MKIILDHIMPTPLASMSHGEDSIWGKYVILDQAKHIVLNASSGKGKSTFTTVTTGIRKDYTGTLFYDDRDIQTFSPSEWAEIRRSIISVVFQDLQLFPKLSVKENLIVKNKLTDTFSEAELRILLERLGIDDKWNQLVGLLSMGQQQRVAIIRALCQPYQWLIMDEPFSHLDKENTRLSLEMIDERTRKQNAGFVLTTLGEYHDYQYDQELKL